MKIDCKLIISDKDLFLYLSEYYLRKFEKAYKALSDM